MSNIVDIITFCEDERFLNFNGKDGNISLFPMQRIILKAFYRTSIGNENLAIYDNEVELIKRIMRENKFDYENDNSLLNQLCTNKNIPGKAKVLLNIIGRQGTKTTLSAIIACYEAYKLCETPNGNPQAYYSLLKNTPISILAVEMSSRYSNSLFDVISYFIHSSPYFENKIGNKSNNHKIHILTDEDKRENKKLSKNNTEDVVYGSVVILDINKESQLRGNISICVLMDELSRYKDQKLVFDSLIPSVKKFKNDGNIIISSSSAEREGLLFNLFYHTPDSIVIQLPTWAINENLTKEYLSSSFCEENNSRLYTEFGARFVGWEEFDREKELKKSGKRDEVAYWKNEAKKAFEKRDAVLKTLSNQTIKPSDDRISVIKQAKYWLFNDTKISMIISFYSSFISALKEKNHLHYEMGHAVSELLVCGELNFSKEREVILTETPNETGCRYQLKNGSIIQKLFKTLKFKNSLEELYLLDMKNIETAKAIRSCNSEILLCCGIPSNGVSDEILSKIVSNVVIETRNILYDHYPINQSMFKYSVEEICEEAKKLGQIL